MSELLTSDSLTGMNLTQVKILKKYVDAWAQFPPTEEDKANQKLINDKIKELENAEAKNANNLVAKE